MKREKAKTGRSKCKACKKVIAKGEVRLFIKDDTEFQAYIRKHGAEGEGPSRGYI